MIKLLGKKRINLLLGLVGANVILILFSTWFLLPDLLEASSQRDQARQQLDALSEELKQLQADISFIQSNRARYDAMQQEGYVGDQNRLALADLIERIRQERGIMQANVQIQPMDKQPIELPEFGAINYQQSNGTIRFSAFLDVQIYRFLADLYQKFPGKMVLTRMDITRNIAYGPEVIDDIARGGQPELITGVVNFEWLNIASKEVTKP